MVEHAIPTVDYADQWQNRSGSRHRRGGRLVGSVGCSCARGRRYGFVHAYPVARSTCAGLVDPLFNPRSSFCGRRGSGLFLDDMDVDAGGIGMEDLSNHLRRYRTGPVFDRIGLSVGQTQIVVAGYPARSGNQTNATAQVRLKQG